MKEEKRLLRARKLGIILFSIGSVFLSGCKSVPIIQHKAVDHVVEVSADQMLRDTFYVKDGTKFGKVFLPNGNAPKEARMLDTSRVLYSVNDEKMIPTHYLGESVAYKSSSFELIEKGLSLERFKDMGWSIGLFGGRIEGDGYYHFDIETNVAFNSNAYEIFSTAAVKEIRVVSIGGKKPKEYVDEASGIICGLEKDKKYTVEFYIGTYYYSYAFTADTHMFKAYEYYFYDGSNIKDTKLSYMSFEMPEDLKTGYYNINGTGLYKYYAYAKGDVPEDVDYNESYYSSEEEQILQYTRQYNLNIPVETKELCLNVDYGLIEDALDEGSKIGGYLISPEGTVYDLDIISENKLMTISLATAMPGDWTIGIYPRSLQINGIDTASDIAMEETFCEEEIFEIEESSDYQAFYADITGEGEVYAVIIAEDGRTYLFEEVTYKDALKKQQRYLICRFPHLTTGTYAVRIYHYKSETEIKNLNILGYSPDSNELIRE